MVGTKSTCMWAQGRSASRRSRRSRPRAKFVIRTMRAGPMCTLSTSSLATQNNRSSSTCWVRDLRTRSRMSPRAMSSTRRTRAPPLRCTTFRMPTEVSRSSRLASVR
uniref:(northern house mosquito) hypothetical protein n=1 Tax=Culex pipiens TaxID=7175 RepID=A0A8D7ZZ22_CULPI